MATKTAVDQTGIIPMTDYTGYLRGQKSPWMNWIESQGVPIVTGVSLYDMYETPREEWGDTGAKAAIINFETGEMSDAVLMEIPPGGQVKPIHHVYHKIIHVIEGRGATSVWNEGSKKKQTFEWQKGSLFNIPLNAWHEHFNGSGSERVLLFCVTSAPLTMNFMPSHDFVFNNSYVFDNMFAGQDDFFSAEGQALSGRVWQSNFIADLRAMETELWRFRGVGGTNRMFSMGSGHFQAHISEFPSGTYKKAHRHGPGAHLFTLSGTGYTLEWNWGKELVEFPWKDGTVYTALNSFWHQHFNTGPEAVRYLAITHGRYHVGLRARPSPKRDATLKEFGDEMNYEDEEAWVREKFQEQCGKRGVDVDNAKMNLEYEKSLPPDSYLVHNEG